MGQNQRRETQNWGEVGHTHSPCSPSCRACLPARSDPRAPAGSAGGRSAPGWAPRRQHCLGTLSVAFRPRVNIREMGVGRKDDTEKQTDRRQVILGSQSKHRGKNIISLPAYLIPNLNRLHHKKSQEAKSCFIWEFNPNPYD